MDFSGKRILTRSAQGLTFGAIVAGTVAFVGADKTVALTVDGNSQDVHTYGTTVADVLDAAGVQVGSSDEVSSDLDAAVATGSTVRVKTAKPVSLDVDGDTRTVDTTADTVADLADRLGLAEDAELNLDPDVVLASSDTPLQVTTPKHVTVDLAGHRKNVTTTATDVAGLLKELGVSPDDDDVVSPARNTVLTSGTHVQWQQITVERKKTTTAVPATSTQIHTDDLDTGRTRTLRAGRAGERTLITEVRYLNSKPLSTRTVSARVTTEPVSRLVQVGTGSPEPDSMDDHDQDQNGQGKSKDKDKGKDKGSGKSEGSSSGSVPGVWQKLAKCESGGNWSTNSGNGFYGGLQFTASTWRAQGGGKYAALPHQASASEQVKIASKLQKRAGWGQWPACTKKLGLR